MNIEKGKKTYITPNAQYIMLTPQETVAASNPWFNSGDAWWWGNRTQHWGAVPQDASKAFGGTYEWYTEDAENP